METIFLQEHAVRHRFHSPVCHGAGWLLIPVACFMATAARAQFGDAPHNATESIDCFSCHITAHSPEADRTTPDGNPNLCLSCHMPGGPASALRLMTADEARTGPGLPADISPKGTSHRWDSGLAGHIEYVGGAAKRSSGDIHSSGDYVGFYAKVYSLTITTAGNAGAARFNWVATQPGGGSGTDVLCGTDVALDQGITVTFADGPMSPSFQLGDRWDLYVRPDVQAPADATLLAAMSEGRVRCSTCHNQHSQQNAPFDPDAPASGAGRHFQRIANNACQLCSQCHTARNVTSAAQGSHPVGVTVPATANFQQPTALPLEKTTAMVRCLTCHDIHNSSSTNGTLLRIVDRIEMCTQCHTLADTSTPGAHFDRVNGVLWPGGQYGSTAPARTDTALRGTCANCHIPHGWPNADNLAEDYPFLLADVGEDLCFTCHDADGPATKNSMTDFSKAVRHPVADDDPLRAAGRTVECADCHNTHQARSGALDYSATATATRNQVGNPNRGASGVSVDYTGLGIFQAPTTADYTSVDSATYEYEICFKCHSGHAWLPGSPPDGLSANGSDSSPVETDLAQEFSPYNRSGHPVVTGLSNYPNSTAVGSPARRGLQPAALKAPWNVNVGSQTMLCTDCHTTDAASPAAQGPHGSAAQFMLRGPNAANWPNLTINSFDTSWCANCHNNSAGVGHTRSDHRSRRCYECHIVIPHGGKLSRLIGDRDTMPSRYAFNNSLSTMQMRSFTKKATSSYGSGDCSAACRHSGGSENW